MKRVSDKIMTQDSILRAIPIGNSTKTENESVLKRARSRWIVGLFLASTAGFFLMISGLGLSGFVAFGLINDPRTKTEITVMLVASFPMLFLAAHCLDKIAEKKALLKIESCNRQGITREQ